MDAQYFKDRRNEVIELEDRYMQNMQYKYQQFINRTLGQHWGVYRVANDLVAFAVLDPDPEAKNKFIFGATIEINRRMNRWRGEEESFTTNIGSCGESDIDKADEVGNRAFFYAGLGKLLANREAIQELMEMMRKQKVVQIGFNAAFRKIDECRISTVEEFETLLNGLKLEINDVYDYSKYVVNMYGDENFMFVGDMSYRPNDNRTDVSYYVGKDGLVRPTQYNYSIIGRKSTDNQENWQNAVLPYDKFIERFNKEVAECNPSTWFLATVDFVKQWINS